MFIQPEIWKPIIGYEDLYIISSYGRVKSLDRITSHYSGGTRTIRGKFMKLSVNRKSNKTQYLRVTLRNKNSKKKTVLIHSLVAKHFIGPRPSKYDVCHIDNNSFNNNVENLRYGTRKSNIKDQIVSGRHKEIKKTHCPRGHKLFKENIPGFHFRKGWRTCLACSKARNYFRKDRPGENLQVVADRYYTQIINNSKEKG